MKTTIYTKFGSDIIAVSADWAQASWSVEGDLHGRQVADFGHEPLWALRAALLDTASIDGLDDVTADRLANAALAKAVHSDTYLPHLHDSDE